MKREGHGRKRKREMADCSIERGQIRERDRGGSMRERNSGGGGGRGREGRTA